MNKNKGTTIIEIVVTLFLVTIIFQLIFIYFKYINIENKRVFIDIQTKTQSEIILKKIQDSFYGACSYKIYKYSNVPKLIDYSKESLKEGNMLLIEKYIPFQEETEVEIYYQTTANYIVSYNGIKNSDNVVRKIEEGEVVLKKININFYLEEFGVTLEGFYFKKKYSKELKK
ncbi:hypothetical protein [Cetobacterium sp.]|uniref:hypothetical protein n=1 Tax=Cetobacterium sp. TaxID=2071632 RepID=UPI003F2F05DF